MIFTDQFCNIANSAVFVYHNTSWYPHDEKFSLQWHHHEHNRVSNHWRLYCLLNHLLRCRSKKMKLRVTCLYVGNSPVAGEFPAQITSNGKMFPFDDVIMFRKILFIFLLAWSTTPQQYGGQINNLPFLWLEINQREWNTYLKERKSTLIKKIYTWGAHFNDFFHYNSKSREIYSEVVPFLWPLLLTWFNFNPSMDK